MPARTLLRLTLLLSVLLPGFAGCGGDTQVAVVIGFPPPEETERSSGLLVVVRDDGAEAVRESAQAVVSARPAPVPEEAVAQNSAQSAQPVPGLAPTGALLAAALLSALAHRQRP